MAGPTQKRDDLGQTVHVSSALAATDLIRIESAARGEEIEMTVDDFTTAILALHGIPSLGSIASQDADAVAITGGSVTGITDLASNAVTITGGSITDITDLAVADGRIFDGMGEPHRTVLPHAGHHTSVDGVGPRAAA